MKELGCILCPNSCTLYVEKNEEDEFVVKGNMCTRGKEFAVQEMTEPKRTVCTTVKTCYEKCRVVSVKTDNPIPKDKVLEVMKEINKINLDHTVKIGDVLLENVLGLQVNIVSTADLSRILTDG